MPFWRLFVLLLLAACRPAFGDFATDIARIHVEAIGGRARVEALRSLRARGLVEAQGQSLHFELLAARPNLIRISTSGGGKILVQGFDGTGAPWRWQPDQSQPIRDLKGDAAAAFLAEAEFDDPLIDPDRRGYRLEFGGEDTFQGRRVLRVQVAHPRQPSSVFLVDAETYFILARQVERPLPSGAKIKLETIFDDFMPVLGVVLPRRVTAFADGVRQQLTLITDLEGNPAIEAAQFRRPVQPVTR